MQVKNKKIGLKRSFLFRITFPVIFIIVLCYLMQSDFGIEIIFGENVNTNHWRNYQTTTFFANDGSGWVAFFTCFTFLYPLYWFFKWSDRCPSCKSWSANKVLEEKIIDYDEFKSNFSETTKENNVSTTKYYKRTTETVTYNVFHKCKFCDHLWNTEKTKRSVSKERI